MVSQEDKNMYIQEVSEVSNRMDLALSNMSTAVEKNGVKTDINELYKFIAEVRSIKKKFLLIKPTQPFMRLHRSLTKAIRKLNNIANVLEKSIKKKDIKLFNKTGRMMIELSEMINEADDRLKEFI